MTILASSGDLGQLVLLLGGMMLCVVFAPALFSESERRLAELEHTLRKNGVKEKPKPDPWLGINELEDIDEHHRTVN